MISLQISGPLSPSRIIVSSTIHSNCYRFLLTPISLCRNNSSAIKLAALNGGVSDGVGKFTDNKPSVCTADELHYVLVPNSDWKLALWRYKPPPNPMPRNHPLLLLSGVATNAIGFDLSPESSFARHMSSHGYDTWILEVRGAGLSTHITEKLDSTVNRGTHKEMAKSGVSLEKQNSDIASQINSLSERLVNIVKGQRSVSPQYFEDLQKQIDLITKYNWDFDHHLEEDVPAAMEYIRTECKPKDGKLLAVGHSMGGILLYATLSRHILNKRDPGFVSMVTLGSSLDYSSSKSSLKLFLPMADPAKALNVPVVPIGAMLAAAHPLASRLPYVLSWLNPQISAQHMMRPHLYEKLVLNNFGTVPAKLLLQLSTALQEGGLRDRNRTFFYKDLLRKSNVPILAIAGDQDLICPPEAVYETIKCVPEQLITYKVFGEPGGPHYAHYDLVGGLTAAEQVYPYIIKFLNRHDST